MNVLDEIDTEDSQAPKRPPAPKVSIPPKLLDLKFLIQLEQDGFTGSLKYYKYFHLLTSESQPPSGNPRAQASGDAARINEIKLLIQHVYAFFGAKKLAPQRSQLPDQPLQSDLSQISGHTAEVSHYSRYATEFPTRPQKNVYFKCLVNCVIDTV